MELIKGPIDLKSKDITVDIEITEIDGFLGIGLAKSDWMEECKFFLNEEDQANNGLYIFTIKGAFKGVEQADYKEVEKIKFKNGDKI